MRIKAAVARAFGAPLGIEEVELRAPGPGEVEVTLGAVAICQSDISFIDGGWGGGLPAVYGHEAAGRVSAVGDGAPYAVGESVIVTLIRSCGACRSCATGHPVTCETPYDRMAGPLSLPDGTPVSHGLNCGAFAERVVVQASQLARVPEALPAEEACLLACGVITGLGAAVNTARIRPGEDVVVIGAGGVGLNAIQGARLAGARRIVAVDRAEAKRDAALAFGATDFVAAEGKPWQAVREIAPRGADAVLVSVGATQAYDAAPRYLAPGGRVVMVGMPHSGAMSSYEPVILAALQQGMTGSLMGDVVLSRDIPWIVDLVRQGRLKIGELISGRFPLEEINAAIADTRTGAARRNVIVFP